MGVDVDEARCHQGAVGVDLRAAAPVDTAHLDHQPTGHRHVGGPGRRSRSVDDRPTPHHHVELGQSIEGTLWQAPAPGHAHHVGYWVDDVVAASAALHRLGSPRVATIAMTDDAPPMCAYHRTTNGLYVEVVSRGLRRVLLPEERG